MLDMLRRPQWIVIDPEVDASLLSLFSLPVRGALYTAVITARTAYMPGVAGAVVGWAVDNGHLAVQDESAARTALSEAIANSLFHGSLGLTGMDSYSADPDGYFEDIAARLNDEAYGASPIVIRWRRTPGRLWLHVEDAGRGGPEIRSSQTHSRRHLAGRGRNVMAAMAGVVRYTLNGRRTSMGFSHV
ncbi:hypothetical protein CCP2SC5_610006 [Azospirillaceae bacterium]